MFCVGRYGGLNFFSWRAINMFFNVNIQDGLELSTNGLVYREPHVVGTTIMYNISTMGCSMLCYVH